MLTNHLDWSYLEHFIAKGWFAPFCWSQPFHFFFRCVTLSTTHLNWTILVFLRQGRNKILKRIFLNILVKNIYLIITYTIDFMFVNVSVLTTPPTRTRALGNAHLRLWTKWPLSWETGADRRDCSTSTTTTFSQPFPMPRFSRSFASE